MSNSAENENNPSGRIGSWRKHLREWASAEWLREHEDKVLLILTLVIGALVGLVVVAFILVTENLGSRMYPAGGVGWRRLVIPVFGALITGYLLQRYFPYARGSGIPQTKTALFIYDGFIRFRTVVGKFFCSSVSLASGNALGCSAALAAAFNTPIAAVLFTLEEVLSDLHARELEETDGLIRPGSLVSHVRALEGRWISS